MHLLRSLAVLLICSPLLGATVDPLTTTVEQWRAKRVAALTSDTGWLTLVALLPLPDGSSTFGRDPASRLRLDHAALPASAGTFEVSGNSVTFTAAPDAGVTQNGAAVTRIELRSDADGQPTLFDLGTLQLFVIDRSGHRFVRIRDRASARRQQFKGIEYFPIRSEWSLVARFEPYLPEREVTITNILGLEERMRVPGALVFEKGGRSWRLDAIDEDPKSAELFLMFADGTTARTTYGAGRYLYVPRPRDGAVPLDFNRAYSPPCAFNDFATCPLPPQQNKLTLRITAGEKKPRHW